MKKALLGAGTAGLIASLGLGGCSGHSDPVSGAAVGLRTPGVPPGGPAVLYAPPPDIPQLQNRDARFRAPFEMVSGTERYVDGEYLYTDFLYDDEKTIYPDDFARYANNAADLVEFRLTMPREGGLAVRFTLNTLLLPDSSIVTVAFDSDDDPATGNDKLPRDPGMAFPGTDSVLTTWGTGAEWSTWDGSAWETIALAVHTDLEANQITVTVPKNVADPRGQWKATLATGLFDSASGGWLTPGTAATSTSPSSKIINLGFRFDEITTPPPPRELIGGGGGAPYDGQTDALSAGTPTRYARLLDFDLLRRRGARDNVPTHGMIYRMFASRLPGVRLGVDEVPNEKYGDALFFEGKARDSDVQYLSPLQPYALYVPADYRAAEPAPLTFYLHGSGGEYFDLNGPLNFLVPYAGDARNSILLSPSARGSGGFYVGDLEHDLFEAWNDVARHYALDPRRTAVTGVSMGGYGTYRMALLWPHLLARAVPFVPAICRGIWFPGVTASGGEQTLSNHWIENARNLPIFHIADSASELTFFPGQAQQAIGPAINGMQSLDSNGYRYRFWAVAADHVAIGINVPEVTEFLGRHQIEPQPFHVTYARMPSNDSRGLVHNQAYWLSGIELRDARAPVSKGVIDALSLGFGLGDPTSTQTVFAGVMGPPTRVGGLPLGPGWPYVETQRSWSEPPRVPVENRIVIQAKNIASVTIDPQSARVDCKARLDIDSDGPLQVRLLGCP